MLTPAQQFSAQQRRAWLVRVAQRAQRGGRGPEPFPGVVPLLTALVADVCVAIGRETQARWQAEGLAQLQELLAQHPELRA